MLVRAYLGCGSAAAAGVAEPHCAIGPPFSKQNQSSLKDSPSWPLFWLFMFVCLFVGGLVFFCHVSVRVLVFVGLFSDKIGYKSI